MNQILKTYSVLFLLSGCAISHAVAATETRVIRTDNGQLVHLGDSYIQLLQNMAQQPVSVRHYEWEEGDKKFTASDYVYLLENTYYTVTVVDNAVKKIVWDRKI